MKGQISWRLLKLLCLSDIVPFILECILIFWHKTFQPHFACLLVDWLAWLDFWLHHVEWFQSKTKHGIMKRDVRVREKRLPNIEFWLWKKPLMSLGFSLLPCKMRIKLTLQGWHLEDWLLLEKGLSKWQPYFWLILLFFGLRDQRVFLVKTGNLKKEQRKKCHWIVLHWHK